MTTSGIDRRTFLHALGAGSGALFLDALCRSIISEARAAAPPPRRLVLFMNGNGLHEERYRTTVRSETSFDLPPIFAPLAPYKDSLLIIQKLYNPHNQELHGNGWATLSVMPSRQTAAEDEGPLYTLPSGISLDRLLAREIGKGTAFPSINLGLLMERDVVPHGSSDGPGRAFPAEKSPVVAYSKIFGALRPQGITTRELLLQHRSVLDFVAGDAGRLLRRLSGQERAKMEQYLESIRALEMRLTLLEQAQGACAGALGPAARLDTLQQSRGPVQPDVIAAHIELAANALACGLTRVAAISIHGNAAAHNNYSFLGDNEGHHQQCHNRNDAMIGSIDAFVASQVGKMVERLRAVREGAGTMADSTLVMWVNSGGGKHHNGWNSHAAVLIGRAGGYFRTGRYLIYPEKERCMSDLYVSVANAMGVPIERFGDERYCKGPLPGLR